MGVIDSIGSAFKAVASFFGWAQQRDAEKNSPEMKANAAAKTDAAIASKVAEADTAAASGDLSKAEKLAAE
jgi:hypothetical protein